MRALVVYESIYGNTQAVAQAIADGLAATMEVQLVEVGAAPQTLADDVDLLVVGGPTHAHGMTKPDSRESAARKADGRQVSRGSGIREWLETVRLGAGGTAAAAFDTRIKGPAFLWGAASKGADAELRRLGLQPVVPPASFLIGGPTGPVFDRLLPGEAERARAWGAMLAESVAAR
ncbi:MAG: flavodoxin domain-containing protein [Chloroflexi bacterium]|nr:flavodoxin domain-containing protein [Chloroflexota bacterium]